MYIIRRKGSWPTMGCSARKFTDGDRTGIRDIHVRKSWPCPSYHHRHELLSGHFINVWGFRIKRE